MEDLEHWIAERDMVASSQEMGQDIDHVMVNRNLPPDKAQLLSLCIFSHTYILGKYNYNQYFPDFINNLDPAR